MEQITLIYLENNDGDDYCKCVLRCCGQRDARLATLECPSVTIHAAPLCLFRELHIGAREERVWTGLWWQREREWAPCSPFRIANSSFNFVQLVVFLFESNQSNSFVECCAPIAAPTHTHTTPRVKVSSPHFISLAWITEQQQLQQQQQPQRLDWNMYIVNIL